MIFCKVLSSSLIWSEIYKVNNWLKNQKQQHDNRDSDIKMNSNMCYSMQVCGVSWIQRKSKSKSTCEVFWHEQLVWVAPKMKPTCPLFDRDTKQCAN